MNRKNMIYTKTPSITQMNEKYTFISYAHKDKKYVMKEIKRREKLGQVFWYDKSIEAGSDWADSIAVNLQNASSVLYFDSPAARKSDNCKRELAYASEHNIPVETLNLGGATGTIVGIIVLLAAIYLGCYLTVFKTVPYVVGFKTDDAVEIIEEYGFKSAVSYDYSDEYPLGLIMEQKLHGKTFPFVPIGIVQSLGPESELTIVPDTVGNQVSEGVRMLADAGLQKFSITAKKLGDNKFGTITYQSAPAGYKVSKECKIDLSVATDETTIRFEYNGTTITIPSVEGDMAEIDLIENTVEYIEGYKERNLDDAEVIYIKAGDAQYFDNITYDKTVVISGESGAVTAFISCTFNGDVIIKTGNEEIMVGIDKGCTVNGNLCIINNIMESDMSTPLPKFVIETPHSVVVEHGSGTCFMLEKEDFYFNGEKKSFNETGLYIDKSGSPDSVMKTEDAGENASMYFASAFMEKGVAKIEAYTSNINAFPERNNGNE